MDPWAHIYAKHKTYITSRVQSWNSPHTQTRGKKRFCQKSCELKSLRAPWWHTTQTHLGVHTHIHAPTHLQTCYAKAFFTNFNKKSCLIYTLCHLHDLFRSQLFVRRASSSFIRESARECACERERWLRVNFSWERERGTHKTLWQAPNGIQLSEICGNAYQFQESNLKKWYRERRARERRKNEITWSSRTAAI